MSRGLARRVAPWPLLLLGFTVCNTTSEDELHCAEAEARLEACCPGFGGAFALGCETSGGESCGPSSPSVSREEAACIQAASCEALQADLVCARALALAGGGPRPPDAPPGLCP